MNNKRKQLMIISGGLGSGGLDRVVSNIANYYTANNWSVVILCMLDKPEKIFVDLNEHISVEWANPKSMKLNPVSKYLRVLKWIRFIRKNLKSYLPDAVLCMTFKIGSLAMLAKPKKCSARFTVREISDPKSIARSKFMNWITFSICKKIDSFIFQTDWERKCCPKSIQCKGEVIPNPVNLNVFCDLSEKKEKRIVTMGRLLNKQKRHFVLFDAAKIFLEKHPDYVFEVYGTGPDYEKDVKYLEQLNLTDHVLLKGAVKGVHQIIKNASCFVITSEYEGMSNALLEAFLMGIPCVTSDWPGASEIVSDGTSGLIFKRGNSKQLAEQIDYIISNQTAAKMYSLNAQSQYSKYEINNVMNSYSKVINGK